MRDQIKSEAILDFYMYYDMGYLIIWFSIPWQTTDQDIIQSDQCFDIRKFILDPRGLGKYDKKNVLFITDPQDNFFCFIPQWAKYEF